jgi:pyruvate formate lyase activating enzyme
MPESQTLPDAPLEAKSPFELRVDLGKGVPESDVRAALATGDMGFLHSFTTGATVDGPGVRVVAWTAGCMWRCRYCHNPDTWTMSNGIPVTVTTAEGCGNHRQGLRGHGGGRIHAERGEPLMQNPSRSSFSPRRKRWALPRSTAMECTAIVSLRCRAGTIDLVLLSRPGIGAIER